MESKYDFQAAIEAANAVVSKSDGSGSNQDYKYPLIYPPKGQTMVVRLLFNPQSNMISRLVNRHEKVPCYKTYNVECPICKVQQQVKDLTGQDPFGRSMSSKARGISFAQFVSSTSPIDKGGNRGTLTPGELILFMYPYSVYTQINALIQAVAQTPTGMDQAFCHANQGLYVQVSVSGDFKYTTTSVPYMTFNPDNLTDDQFMSMLDKMESLNSQVIPSTITQEVDKQVKEYSDSIYRQFIVPRSPSQVPAEPPMSVSNPAYTQVNYAPSAQSVPDSYPSTAPSLMSLSSPTPQTLDCMGHHEPSSPKCICCPMEVQCTEASGR